jgi:predicted transcriptional regulator
MCEKRSLGYTSVLKTLQVMTEKGLVLRDASARSHVYRPAQTEGQTQRSLVDDLLARAFGGSAMKLVMQALSSKRASKDDLVQIKEMIARAERGEP